MTMLLSRRSLIQAAAAIAGTAVAARVSGLPAGAAARELFAPMEETGWSFDTIRLFDRYGTEVATVPIEWTGTEGRAVWDADRNCIVSAMKIGPVRGAFVHEPAFGSERCVTDGDTLTLTIRLE